MNADFEGGEFIFTEMDAKTVTVSQCCEPSAMPGPGLWASQAASGSCLAKIPYNMLLAEVKRLSVPCSEAVWDWIISRSEGWLRVMPA